MIGHYHVGGPEVADLHPIVLRKQNILWLDIAMQNGFGERVQILHCLYYVQHVTLNCCLRQSVL